MQSIKKTDGASAVDSEILPLIKQIVSVKLLGSIVTSAVH